MKDEIAIEYLKCRADLNFEVDFGVNASLRLRMSGNSFGSENGLSYS